MAAPIPVLLIEDNPGDARLAREELQSVHSHALVQLEWVDCLAKGLECLASDEEALTYIQEQAGAHFEPQVVEFFLKVIK